MKIIDNFLDAADMEDLKVIVLGDRFPWYMNDGVSHDSDGYLQFTHSIFKNNEFVSSYTLGGLDIFKEKLKIKKLVRAKFNLLHQTENIIEHGFHTDIEEPSDDMMTAILYLNSNDGYTRFENSDKVHSIENRLVLFNTNSPHGGSTCTNKKYRAVFNLNFIQER
tara:strand:- start:632 stop:1126 length:495 start_codon:yes stop_codon:yes gene_type:complete